MSSRFAAIALTLLVGAFAAGCGRVDLTSADPTAATTVTSAPQVQQTAPVVVMPTPAPAQSYNPPLQMGQLTAALTSFDTPGFLGFLGHATAHVTVTNSTQVPLSGTLTVQFTDSGQAQGTPQTQQVSVGAAASQQIDVTEAVSFHFVDSASVSVTTTPPAGTSGTYGVPGSASSIYGTPPSASYTMPSSVPGTAPGSAPGL